MGTVPESSRLAGLEQENQRLRRAVEELSILNEIATAISSTQSLDRIVDLMVQKSVKHLNVEQAAVMLLHAQQEEDPFQTMLRRADSSRGILPFRLNSQLNGWMLKYQKPLLINDFHHDERFKDLVEKNFPIRSLLSVPLLCKGKMIGMINVFNKKAAEGFTGEDQRLLTIIAAQSAQVLENARLAEEEKLLIAMQQEMRMAAEIQANLLPRENPRCPGYDIAGKSISAAEVGGDYFDFIPIAGKERLLALCLGDVSGKGLPAALLMSNVQATIRSQAIVAGSPKAAIENANTLVCQTTAVGKFVTLFYGILDTETHQLAYCNAGHDHPYLVAPGAELRRLGTGGVVLGFAPRYLYAEETLGLAPGSRVVIYSDGVTEAKNQDDEEFGEERLQALALESATLSSGELIDKIIEAVRRHSGNTPQSDDITLVVISRR